MNHLFQLSKFKIKQNYIMIQRIITGKKATTVLPVITRVTRMNFYPQERMCEPDGLNIVQKMFDLCPVNTFTGV
jgi:hypothetical protein